MQRKKAFNEFQYNSLKAFCLFINFCTNASRTYPLIDLSHSIIPTSLFAVPPCCMVVQFDSEYGTFLDCNYVFLFSRLTSQMVYNSNRSIVVMKQKRAYDVNGMMADTRAVRT